MSLSACNYTVLYEVKHSVFNLFVGTNLTNCYIITSMLYLYIINSFLYGVIFLYKSKRNSQNLYINSPVFKKNSNNTLVQIFFLTLLLITLLSLTYITFLTKSSLYVSSSIITLQVLFVYTVTSVYMLNNFITKQIFITYLLILILF